ncbi:fluoride efflux transporter CrcB [Sulfurospirillum diekertiae]|uniref:Fluoride-specific ion channel FluC n=1 Tax=Sulfurospirillum diekertiae TaxID=1854492 RepID=A0A1Y0HR75_9BACT|nr:fluoride efflux transporter CrcB [Sulfurospirillum diekertiae]ARU49824.1 Putative fluoride ion transporter CrcB [Sulfurospirillum diekertiae]ASC94615.1 Putative fluoride ion transporter CrcB [Sulfurospirillum diekertiae]
MFYTVLAIFSGAGFGALLRWFLGTKLNSIYPSLPLGTLSANLLGGYLIGLAIAFFASNTALTPEWRLFIITGFLGGLTTFSTFSAEIVTLIQEGRLSLSIMAALLHVIGSITMTFLGIASYTLLQKGSL